VNASQHLDAQQIALGARSEVLIHQTRTDGNPDSTASQDGMPVASMAYRLILAAVLSGGLVAGSFIWQGHYGFNTGDEGFLWYGAQRVMAGEVPLRDFMSYDPGRYYWSAALMAIFRDDGILALRAAVAGFQLLGLFVGLLLLMRNKPRPDAVLMTLAAVTLAVWMYPRHKLFDISLSIALIGVLTLVVKQPSPRRFFAAGAGIGLIAVFGRNHGIYGAAGFLGATIYLACRRPNIRELGSNLLCGACGIVVGFLPILVLAVAAPGFAAAFWRSIRAIFERGTNLPLPVPWPWLVPVTRLPPATAAAEVLTGILFIAILAFGVLGFLWVIRQALRQRPVPPALVASSVLVLPYAHFAFSRAEYGHLAQSIFPFLIGVFILLQDLPRIARRTTALAMAAASLLIMLPHHPGWECRVRWECETAEVGGSALKVDPDTANTLAMLNEAVGRYAPDGRSFLATPWLPSAYALFKRKSPVWEIYALFPASDEFQRQEIERIKAAQPGFVVVQDAPLDGRDDLRFRNTHPLIEQFIRDNFDPIQVGNDPTYHQFYKSR
jgi:hypothetical protein